MNKPKVNYVVDIFLLVAFLVTATSALVIYFFLPYGIVGGGAREFFGIAKRVWAEWHEIFGLAFIALALLHFILHFGWIGAMTKGFFKKNTDVTPTQN